MFEKKPSIRKHWNNIIIVGRYGDNSNKKENIRVKGFLKLLK